MALVVRVNIFNRAHLTSQGEQSRHHLGEVLAFPQVDGLEYVHVGHSVRFYGLLETVNGKRKSYDIAL